MFSKVAIIPGVKTWILPDLDSVDDVVRRSNSGVLMFPVRDTPSPSEKTRVKVFVIDPKKFQKDGNGRKTPAAATTTITAVSKFITNPLPPRNQWILPAHAKENLKDEEDEQEQEDLMSQLLTKKFRTRAGRITKPRNGGLSTGPSSVPPTTIPTPHVRRREPPEFFRCQTCQKFYVGNAKMKAHLKKFPTHEGSPEYRKTIAPKRKVSHASVAVQFEEETTPLIEEQESRRLRSPTSVGPPFNPEFQMPLSVVPPSGETIFDPMTAHLSDSNSMTIPQIRNYNDVHSGCLNGSPSPSSNSLPLVPFWNAFSSFSSRGSTSRDESSPEDGTGVESISSRKEELGDLNSFGASITIWDLVEKKLVQNGINQILTELSDVAEKLGKIARDKIIPIREDEEERLPNSTPIVRVENPFMSHLLDLPFGTYVFREDGGIRRPPLPPPSTDLSLTAGEVDIDKFLACNMEMDLSLPHLTSLDIAAVCNN